MENLIFVAIVAAVLMLFLILSLIITIKNNV